MHITSDTALVGPSWGLSYWFLSYMARLCAPIRFHLAFDEGEQYGGLPGIANHSERGDAWGRYTGNRTAAMVIIGTYARIAWAPDYPYGTKPDEWRAMLERMEQGWGKGVLLSAFAQSLANDASAREWWARFQRKPPAPARQWLYCAWTTRSMFVRSCRRFEFRL